MQMFIFTGIILQEADSFTALCPELDVASQGSSPTQAKEMLIEAATLHLQGAIEDGLPYYQHLPSRDDPRNTSPSQIVEEFHLKVDVDIRVYA